MYKQIKQWFGYGLHLIAGTHYEIPVAFEVTPDSASEHVELLLWREEKNSPDYDPSVSITRPLFSGRADTIFYTERGTIHCVCPETGEMRDMAFQGSKRTEIRSSIDVLQPPMDLNAPAPKPARRLVKLTPANMAGWSASTF